jgi:hypothetical protein
MSFLSFPRLSVLVFCFRFSHFILRVHFPFHFVAVMDARSNMCYLTTEHTAELVQSKKGQPKGILYRGCAVSTYILHTYVPSVWTASLILAVKCTKWREIERLLAAHSTNPGTITNAIFEVLTAVLIKIQVLCDMRPCILVMCIPPSSWYKQFKQSAIINCSDPEDEGNSLHLFLI